MCKGFVSWGGPVHVHMSVGSDTGVLRLSQGGTPVTRSVCARMVSSLEQVGSAHSFSRPLHAAVASTLPSDENAAAAKGRSSPTSLHCAYAHTFGAIPSECGR